MATVSAAITAYNANKLGVVAQIITDTAANIAANLDTLNAMALGGKIASITFSTTPTLLSITATQLQNDTAILAKLPASYTLSISAVLAANTAAVAANAHVTTFVVSDTAANIAAKIADFITAGTKLTTITETGTIASVALTAAQYSTTLTAKFSNFTATVSGVLSANAATTLTNTKVASIAVTDTAANLATNLNALQTAGAKLTAITQSDTGPLTITSAQLTADAAALAKINAGVYTLNVTGVTAATTATVAANTHVVGMTVTDTSANIALNLNTLQANVAKISTITQSGTIAALAITAIQLVNDAAALGKISGTYTLSVSAVLAANTAAVAANTHVTSFVVSDSATNVAAKIADFITAGTKLTTITETGTITPVALAFSQYSTTLTAKFSNFTATVNGVPAASAATILTNTKVASIAVLDTAANLATNLNALQTAGTKLTAITQSDTGPLTITSAQLTADAAALAKINAGVYTLNVTGVTAATTATLAANTHVVGMTVTDTTANIRVAANLTALINAGSKLTSITESGTVSAIALTAAQYSTAFTSKFTNFTATVSGVLAINAAVATGDAKVTSITVIDSSANIASNIDALQKGIAKITTITQSGTLAALTITATQLTNDAGVLAKLASYTLIVTNVLAANEAAVIANAKVISTQVSDSAQNIAANLDALQKAGTKLTAITQSDTGSLTITSAQLTADAATLAKINAGVYTLNVTGVTAATTATVAANTHVVGMTVTDTAANLAVAANLTALINAGSKLTSITESGTVSAIALTAAQYSNTFTAKFTNFTATVSGVLAANAGVATGDAKVTSITVLDSGANLAANLDNLHTSLGKISAIAQSDAGPLTISASQMSSDADVLVKLGTYSLVVSNVLAADATGLIGNSHVTSISISDTAADISTNLDALHANLGKISAIIQSDSDPLTITAAQLTTDADALTLFLANNPNQKFVISNATGAGGNQFGFGSISLSGSEQFYFNHKSLLDHSYWADYFGNTHKLSYSMNTLSIDQAIIAFDDPNVFSIQVLFDSGKKIGSQISVLNANIDKFWGYFATDPIYLNQSDYLNHQNVLSKNVPGSAVYLDISDVNVADLAKITSDSRVIHISFVENSFITENQYNFLYNNVGFHIGDGKNFTVTDVIAADIAKIANDQIAQKISVVDTLNNIQKYQSQIEEASSSGLLTTLKFSVDAFFDQDINNPNLFSFLQSLKCDAPVTISTYNNVGIGLSLAFPNTPPDMLLSLQALFNEHPSWDIEFGGPNLELGFSGENIESLFQLTNSKILSALEKLNVVYYGGPPQQVVGSAQNVLDYFESDFYSQIASPKNLASPFSSIQDTAANISIYLDKLEAVNSKISNALSINIVDSLKGITSHFPDLIAAMNAGELGTITLTDPADLQVQASDINPNFTGGAAAVNQLATHFTNIPQNSVTILGVPVIQDMPGHVSTYAYAFASLNVVQKVVLSNSWTDLQGNNVNAGIFADPPANTIHKNIPWMPYSQYKADLLHKIYAADGSTHAMTKVNDAPLMADVQSLLANDPSLYGVSLAGADTTYTHYSNYIDFHIGSLGTTNLVVIDTPASVFTNTFVNNTASHTTYIVTATAAEIGGNIDQLQAHYSMIDSIHLADPQNAIHMTGAQSVTDAPILNHIDGPFSLYVQGDATNGTLLGQYGNDTLIGGSGNETLSGGTGFDVLTGGSGADTFNVTIGTDTVTDLGNGIDVLKVASGAIVNATVSVNWNATVDTINSGVANLTTDGHSVSVYLANAATNGFTITNIASTGTTSINGSNSSDTITGGAGNDSIYGNGGNDLINGGDGKDTLNGGAGNDTIHGGVGWDSLVGGSGNDILDGGVVTDHMNYADANTASYYSSTAGVNVDLSAITGDGSLGIGTASDGFGGTDILSNMNFIVGSAYADTILGSTARIIEQFQGGAGNDTIDGGLITDNLNQRNENRISYENASGSVTVDLATGTSSGADGNDTFYNFNQIRGSAYSDHLYGTDRTDITEVLQGMAGNDTIDGRGGNDLVHYGYGPTTAVNVNLATGVAYDGQGGIDTLINIEGVQGSIFDDTLTGGNAASGTSVMDYKQGLVEFFRGGVGNDTIDGGQGYDRADYQWMTGAVQVDLSAGIAHDGQGGIDTLINIEGVRGSTFDDTLVGSNGVFESFEGREGNDYIDGKGGEDRVDYKFAIAGANVNLAAGTAQDGYGYTDTFINIEDARGSRDFADTLIGNSSDNRLEGMGGSDTIDGGAGIDTAAYSGVASDYTVTYNNTNQTYTVTDLNTNRDNVGHGDGTDTLSNIEYLEFDGDLTQMALGVTVANLSTVLTNPKVGSVYIVDTAANISSALDTLKSFNSSIAGIALTDHAPIILPQSENHINHSSQSIYESVLSKIDSNYTVQIPQSISGIDWALGVGLNNSYNYGGITSLSVSQSGIAIAGSSLNTGSYPSSIHSFVGQVGLDGQIQWVHQFDDVPSDFYTYSAAVAKDSLGNIFDTRSGLAGNVHIDKLSSTGNLLWTIQDNRYENSTHHDHAITVDASGNLVVIGTSAYMHLSNQININGSVNGGDGSTGYVGKIDSSSGQILWESSIISNGGVQVDSVAADSAGNTYVAGNANGQGFVTKLNSAGDKLWSASTSGGLSDAMVQTDSAGGVYLAGSNHLYKYDSSGNQVWDAQYGGSYTHSIAISSAGDIAIVGGTISNFDGSTNYQGGWSDWYVTVFDNSGNRKSTQLLGTGSNEDPFTVGFDENNNLYLAGYTEGSLGGVSNTIHNQVPVILKLDADSNEYHIAANIGIGQTFNPNQLQVLGEWGGNDTINYSSLLTAAGSLVDSSGHASFSDDTLSLNSQIQSIEQSMAAANDLSNSHVAIWGNGGNTYVLMQNATASSGPSEALVEIVGVDSSHVALNHGAIVHI